MKHARLSIAAFGIYLIVLGAILIAQPAGVFGLIDVPLPDDAGFGVAGVLAMALGSYFLRAAQLALVPFFRWSVLARSGAAVGLAMLYFWRDAPAALLGFALVDLLAAGWTAWTLRQSDST